jgi:Protein of unknown function (DUF3040)
MPLNEQEQKILEEIERRLSEEDPRLVEQVSRTNLHTHAWGRMKMAMAGFVVGLLLLLLVGVSVWIAAAGFVLMTLSALLAYRYAGRLGDDRADSGTFGRLAARVAGRLRRPASGMPPEE